jgi:hypothetical protein
VFLKEDNMSNKNAWFVLENEKFSFQIGDEIDVYLNPWGNEIVGKATVKELKPTWLNYPNDRGRVPCTETYFELDGKASNYYKETDFGFAGMSGRLYIMDKAARLERMRKEQNLKRDRILSEKTPHIYGCSCGMVMKLNNDVEDIKCPVCEEWMDKQ